MVGVSGDLARLSRQGFEMFFGGRFVDSPHLSLWVKFLTWISCCWCWPGGPQPSKATQAWAIWISWQSVNVQKNAEPTLQPQVHILWFHPWHPPASLHCWEIHMVKLVVLWAGSTIIDHVIIHYFPILNEPSASILSLSLTTTILCYLPSTGY